MNNESRFLAMHLVLPPAPEPKGVYTPMLRVGNLVYLSGHLPINEDGSLVVGKIGKELDQEAGKLAARQVALTMVSTLISNLGSLNRVKRVIKVFGMVNAIVDFEKQPYVIKQVSFLFEIKNCRRARQ